MSHVNDISKAIDLITESHDPLIRALEIIDGLMDHADPLQKQFLERQKNLIGKFIEKTLFLNAVFDDECFDPENNVSLMLRDVIKRSNRALCGVPFSGYIGE